MVTLTDDTNILPQIGNIKKSKELGLAGYYKYTWHACVDCGKQRWVRLCKGRLSSLRCTNHNSGKQRSAENNSHWNPNSKNRHTGQARARYWYPLRPCEVCGKKSERHHRDGDDFNNAPSNIQFLCRKHHMGVDGRRKNWNE